MIRHICMFKFKEENREENVKECLKRAQVLGGLSMIEHFEVVANSPDAPQDNYEVSLICDFASMHALQEYQVSPEHIEFGNFIKAVRDSRACIDYEI